MKSRTVLSVITVLSFLLCLIPGIPAYVVSGMSITPPGNQPAGTSMTVTFSIDFPRGTSNVTFPQDSTMHMSTDLTGARWVPVMVLDGMTTKMDATAGKSSDISGWYLSYPSYQNLDVHMTLTGTVPDNPSASQNLVRVEEVDATGYIKSSARVAMPEAPPVAPSVNPNQPAQVQQGSAESQPTKKPVIKKTFTPIPTGTPAEQSPAGTFTGLLAVAVVSAIFLLRKR